jgi:hypothetical protein
MVQLTRIDIHVEHVLLVLKSDPCGGEKDHGPNLWPETLRLFFHVRFAISIIAFPSPISLTRITSKRQLLPEEYNVSSLARADNLNS